MHQRQRDDFPQTIDQSNNVSDKFANVYHKLYNSKQDQDETLNILVNVNTSIDILSLNDTISLLPIPQERLWNKLKQTRTTPSLPLTPTVSNVPSNAISTPSKHNPNISDPRTCKQSLTHCNDRTSNQRQTWCH